MTARLVIPLCCVCLIGNLRAAAEVEPKSRMKEVLRARAIEEAKKKPLVPPAPAVPPSAATITSAPVTTVPAESKPALPPESATAEAAAEPTTTLPKVEVKRERVTILDHQLHEQDKEIAREKKNTVQSEMDKALNNSKVAKALSIFGGESSQYRASIAKERVSMMEEEKDLMEAIAFAKTKAEKADLQKQLDELKAMRRDLEKSLR
jgi:hypothetical protein